MADILNNIISIIFEEKTEYEKLLNFAIEKKEILVNGNINLLDNIVKEEQDILVQLTALEFKKQQQLQDYSKTLDVPIEEVNMTFLVEHAEESQREKIRNLSEGFTKIIVRIGELNDVNTRLIESQLDYIDMSFNLITGSDKSTSYDNDGSVKNTSSGGVRFLDQMV